MPRSACTTTRRGWGPQYLPIDEDHPLRPIDFYSLSKECTESICRSYSNRGNVEVIAIRPTHIVFPPEYPELEARGADVQNYHLWTYVAPDDVAEGFRYALNAVDDRYGAYFITASDGLNTRPTLELLRERYGTLPPIRNATYFERHPPPPFSTAGEPATASVSRPRSPGARWSPSAKRRREKGDEPQRAVLWLQHFPTRSRVPPQTAWCVSPN